MSKPMLIPAPPAPSLWQDHTFLGLIAGAGAIRLAMVIGAWVLVMLVSNNPPLEVFAFNLRSIDALDNHRDALHIMDYWARMRSQYLETFVYSYVIAIFYKAFGPHPMVMGIVGNLFYTGVGLFAYGIAVDLGREPWERRSLAILICMWPSTLVWAATPLKDSAVVFSVFGLLFCWLRLMNGRPGSGLSWAMTALGLIASIFSLVCLRYYFWYLLWGLLLLIPLAQVLPLAKGQSRLGWSKAAGLALLVVVGLALSSTFRHDGIIHFNEHMRPQSGTAWNIVPTAFASEGKLNTGPSAEANSSSIGETPEFLQSLAAKISEIRRTSVRYGGASISPEGRLGEEAVDITKDFQTWPGALKATLKILKAGLRDLFLFPYPWETWPEGKGWGLVQFAVAAQISFWYLLLPGLIAGLVIGLRKRPSATITLTLWALVLGLLLSVTILNRGSLFRLRDMALLPLMLLWDPWPYLKVWRLVGKRGRA